MPDTKDSRGDALSGSDVGDASVTALRKVSVRLLPFLFVLYIIAWLDRVNVGFAALQMNAALGFSASAFGFGSGVFFLGYCLFEVPSNLMLYRVGARRWIARIMITWGLISSALMFVQTPTSFYVLRFLLGVAEAGFFPGVIYYLGLWYPAEHRARAIASFMMGIPLAGLVGGPLSGLLLELDGHRGLAGWQWLFLLEGLPAVALGLVTLLVLPDGPAQARWLSHLERQSLESALIEERTVNERTHQIGTVVALTHRVVWRLGFLFLLAVTGFYGYSIWSPLVIQSLTGFSNLGVGLLSGLIALASMICMIASSAHSDRTGERPLHVAVPLLVMAAGFVGCALSRTPVLAIVSLALVPIGHMSAYGAFWSMPSRFLSGQAAAAGIALIATIVNVGGFLGPTAIGLLRDRTGTYTSAFWILGMLAGLSAMLAMQLRGAAVLQQDGQRSNTVTAA